MADNSTQYGNDTIATNDIATGVAAGAKVPRNKVGFGTPGSYADVEASNPLPVTDQTNAPATSSITALGALNANVALGIASYRGVLVELYTGTLNGSLIAQVLVAGTWQRTHFFDPTISTAGLAVTNLAYTGTVAASIWGIFVPAGALQVRVLVSPYTSGTVNAQLSATGAGDNTTFDLTSGKNGGLLPVAGSAIAGSDGTNLRVVKTDNTGVVQTSGAVAGQDVHDAVMAANAVGIGGYASAALPAAVSTDGDFVRQAYDRQGQARVLPQGSREATGNITAISTFVELDTTGMSSVAVIFGAGLTGTVRVDGAVGTGGYVQGAYYDPTNRITGAATLALSGGSSTRSVIVPPGTTKIRIICTAYTSGSATITIDASTIIGYVNTSSGPMSSTAGLPPDGTAFMGKVETIGAAQTSGNSGYASIATDGTGFRVNASNVTGADAHDAAMTGIPIGVGGYASDVAPSAVSANADFVRAWFTRLGQLNTNDASNTETTATLTFSAVSGPTLTLDLSGQATAAAYFAAGLIGTFAVAASYDNVHFNAYAAFFDPSTGTISPTLVSNGSSVYNRSILLPPGASYFRISCTLFTSGSAAVLVAATKADNGFRLQMGSDGAGARVFLTDSGGRQIVNQGTAAALSGYWPVRITDGTNTMPTLDVAARAGFVRVTDGTNSMPTLDTIARAGFVRITDGTNSMPTMDAVARAAFIKMTDGTSTLSLKAASTAAVGTDIAAVVALSPNNNTLANALITKLSDGTNTAAVKASTTAAVTTDPALVTTPSPNGTQNTTTTDVVGTGVALTSTATAAIIAMAGRYSASVNIPSGTLVGTLVVEASVDGGTTYPIVTQFDTANGKVSSLASSSGVAVNASIIGVGGATHYRVRPSVFTSGTATATLRATCVFDPSVIFAQPAGATTQPSLVANAGKVQASMPTALTDATHQPTVLDSQGRQLVGHIGPERQVWKILGATTAQTGANIWVPTSGKKIAITHIEVSTYGTTAGRVILWFAATGTTVYAAQQVAFVGSFAPSATANPGAILQPAVPLFCTTADFCLKITTATALSVDVTVYGYEYN